jgi:hypothetical protein
MSSNFSLVVVNLFIGLCRGSAGLPRLLRDLGYQDRWIERHFHNQDHDIVHPELVLSSKANNHTILLECKSGPNTDVGQLRRYSRVRSRDLVERLFLEDDECGDHDVAIVGLEEHRERLSIALEGGDTMFPLLVANDGGLALALNEFSYAELSDVFRPALDISWDLVPLSWIPFDHDSELWEVAEVVMPLVLSKMVRREPRIDARSICVDASSWSIIGTTERQQMERKVVQVFSEAWHGEFRDFFRMVGDDLVVENNPVELDAARSTLGFQRLQRLQTEMLHRLRAEGYQLSLFN